MITYCVRIISIMSICSSCNGTKIIEIFWSSACLYRISTTFLMVKFKGWTARLGWKMLRSSMLRSRSSLTCESSNWLVERISSNSLRYFRSVVSLSTLWANCIMHRKGVIISCVTLEVSRVRILLFSEILENLRSSEMSRTLTRVHSLFWKVRGWKLTSKIRSSSFSEPWTILIKAFSVLDLAACCSSSKREYLTFLSSFFKVESLWSPFSPKLALSSPKSCCEAN